MAKKKILVVDDNRVMLKFMANLLEKEGHEVRTVEDGFAALTTLAHFTPQILFVDLIMPKIGGDKLCQIARKMQGMADCFTVVVSAAVAESEIDFAAIGADACIAKGPFGKMAEHVLAAVRAADDRSAGDAAPGRVLGLESLYVRQMTKELLSRNRHLQTILESMAEGILEIFEGRVVFANEAAIEFFGLPEERILTAAPQDLFPADQRERVADLLQTPGKTNRHLGQGTPVELNGRLVSLKLAAVRGADHTSIMLIHDITDRKNLERQLQHIQKMEAIGTIASGVAHNFRNTLAGILMNSQVIQLNFPDLKGLMEVTERINTSVRRGTELVESLLQFSRKQMHEELQRIDIVQVTEEIFQIIRRSFDQRIDIVRQMPSELFVMGDHSGLHLALINLCTNARDAMPRGGTLTIRARADGTAALIEVADTGGGMDADTVKKCFDPFFTTKGVGAGTGLGLSTTYGIVKNHGGRIRVRSAPGGGAVFTLRIPLAEPSAEADPPPAAEVPKGAGETILVVDDDHSLLQAMPALLEALGYRAILADDPREALAHFRRWRPDAILLDRNLPAVDGLACAEQILEMDPSARIVIVSGYAADGPDGIDARHRDRIWGYLTKPVAIEDLRATLHRVLAEPPPSA